MKTKLLCLFFIAFSISAHSQKKSLKIEGAWKMVQSQTIKGNESVIDFPGKVDNDITKIWSGNQCMAVGRTKQDKSVSDMYFLGTFTLIGNRYEENIKILSYTEWEGKTIKMLLEMKNDTLIQTYPVDDKGQIDKNEAWSEKYVRVIK